MKKALWVAPPLSYGSYSMNHYHRELLFGGAKSLSSDEWQIESLNLPVDGAPRRGHTLRRGYDRYCGTPLRVKGRSEFDIYHGLAHDAGALFRLLPKSSVKIATVHDLIPIGKFGGLTEGQKHRFRKQINQLEDFDALFCVSLYTAKKLMDFISVDREKVIVIPNGVDFKRFSERGKEEKIETRPYVLSVSSNHGRKNLKLLPRLFESLDRKMPGMRLVRVGGAFPSSLREEWNRLVGEERLEEISYCTNTELVALYQNASAFVFPSHEEGFGLPVLEAMAAGCPVACSNTSSLPEVGGGIPFLFSPNSSDEAADALFSAITRKDDEDYLKRGLERALQFSWESTFEQIIAQYEKLLDKKRRGH